ncbi:MAG: TRAP transporter large permease subunit [Burkholderiales bacterium]
MFISVPPPVILHVMQHLEINPIWYCVLLVMNLELAEITPPVGMNLFTIMVTSRAPMGYIIRGSLLYVLLLTVGMALVMFWPRIALWLPSTMLNVK